MRELKPGTILVSKPTCKSFKKVEIIRTLEANKVTYFRGKKIIKTVYEAYDLSTIYHRKKDGIKEITSTILERYYMLQEGSND